LEEFAARPLRGHAAVFDQQHAGAGGEILQSFVEGRVEAALVDEAEQLFVAALELLVGFRFLVFGDGAAGLERAPFAVGRKQIGLDPVGETQRADDRRAVVGLEIALGTGRMAADRVAVRHRVAIRILQQRQHRRFALPCFLGTFEHELGLGRFGFSARHGFTLPAWF